MPKEDTIFGLLALRADLISHDQLGAARAQQRRAKRDTGERPALRRVLVERGVITFIQADEVESSSDDGLIPGYSDLEEIGRGGMGVVYRARQNSMDRVVAVKVLSRKLSRDERFIEKFVAEARNAAKLNHPNVITAIDVGESDGLHFFVMEFVEGREAAEIIEEQGRMSPEVAFGIAEQIACALDHAHAHGLIHRDIKPENIMVTDDGEAKLCDLGLARLVEVGASRERGELTEGTPYYVSPEQAMGRKDLDIRTDIYSLGASLFHMLTGRPPYDGDGAGEIMWKQVNKPFPDVEIELPDLSPGRLQVLKRMVEKSRKHRPATPAALIEELRHARQSDQAVTAGPEAPTAGRTMSVRSAVGPALALAALLGLVAIVLGGRWLVSMLGQSASQEQTLAPRPDLNGGGARPRPRPRRDSAAAPMAPRRVERPSPVSAPSEEAGSVVAEGAALENAPEAEALARQLLGDPLATESSSLFDLSASLGRLGQVLGRFQGTTSAGFAQVQLPKTVQRLRKRLDQSLVEAGTRVSLALSKGDFAEAEAALESLIESVELVRSNLVSDGGSGWLDHAQAGGRELLAEVEAAAEVLAGRRLEVEALATLDLDGVLRQAGEHEAAGDPMAGLILVEDATHRSTTGGRVRLQQSLVRLRLAVEQFVALTALGGLRERVFGWLVSGDLDQARAELKEGREDPDLTVVAAGVAIVGDEIERVARAEKTFVERLRLEADAAGLPLVVGDVLRARVDSVDLTGMLADLKVSGRRPLLEGFDLRQLSGDFLRRCARGGQGSGEDSYGAGLLLVMRGMEVQGLAELEAAAVAGAGVPAATLSWARDRALAARSRLVGQMMVSISDEAAAGRHAEVVALLHRLAAMTAGSPAFDERVVQLSEQYRESRVAQIVAARDYGPLCSGKVEDRGRKGHRITYAWADPRELEDWVVQGDVPKDRQGPTLDAGLLKVRDHVLHVVRWERDVAVTMEVRSTSIKRPNVNISVVDDGAGNSFLVGFGYWPPQAQGGKLAVDPAAAARAGWAQALPVSAVVRRVPDADAWRTLFADERSGGALGRRKVTVVRVVRGRGKVVGMIGRKVVSSWKETPETTLTGPGGVGIVPFGEELHVSSVVMEGQLDPAWVASRAEELARVEAEKLFPIAGAVVGAGEPGGK